MKLDIKLKQFLSKALKVRLGSFCVLTVQFKRRKMIYERELLIKMKLDCKDLESSRPIYPYSQQ